MKTVIETLSKIQKELKAPKNQTNAFGKYKYRSCEDILEAIKKVLPDGCAVTVSDGIVSEGQRVYVEATATLWVDDKSIHNTAYAREAEVKKGMDDSQITGTASSYARKYALNGLFMIDDNKDVDSMDNKGAESDKKDLHDKAVVLNSDSIRAIQEGIANNNLSSAAEAWFELDKPTQTALWVAPSKGGCFSTEERRVMKTSEFREAHYGVQV